MQSPEGTKKGSRSADMGVSTNGGSPKWLVYKGKSNENGGFRGTPIYGNPHITPVEKSYENYEILASARTKSCRQQGKK